MEKQKATNLKKRGVEFSLQSEEVRNKGKKTNLERYGVENVSKSEQIKEKIRKTNFEKYGVECVLQSEEVRNKGKKTNLERYGVEYTFQSEEVKEKIRKTNLERYGVENVSKSEEIKENTRKTNLERYGVEYTFQSEEVKEKIRKTNFEKYGVSSTSQRHLKEILTTISEFDWWKDFTEVSEVKLKLLPFMVSSTINIYTKKFRPDLVGLGTISTPHQIVIDILKSLDVSFLINDRTIINPLELDIFIPHLNLAIEINGIFWHSELSGKDKNYHLDKLKRCENKGIKLLHFWDIEILNKLEIVSSIIKNHLKKSIKISARKTILKEISSSEEEKKFLDENHLQGYTPSQCCFGLYYEEELVCLMTFIQSRYRKNIDWELLRFCNKKGVSVVGGASKLFSKRPKGSIISYADKRFSSGSLYKNQLGMKEEKDSPPNSYYFQRNSSSSNNLQLKSRIVFQKHKLKNILENFIESKSAWENLIEHGFDRVWDCGNKVFIKY